MHENKCLFSSSIFIQLRTRWSEMLNKESSFSFYWQFNVHNEIHDKKNWFPRYFDLSLNKKKEKRHKRYKKPFHSRHHIQNSAESTLVAICRQIFWYIIQSLIYSIGCVWKFVSICRNDVHLMKANNKRQAAIMFANSIYFCPLNNFQLSNEL